MQAQHILSVLFARADVAVGELLVLNGKQIHKKV